MTCIPDPKCPMSHNSITQLILRRVTVTEFACYYPISLCFSICGLVLPNPERYVSDDCKAFAQEHLRQTIHFEIDAQDKQRFSILLSKFL